MTIKEQLLAGAGVQPPEPSLLDEYFEGAPALAKELNTTERAIYRWRSLRKGPPGTFIGGRLYFRKSAVKQWLLDNEEVA